MKKEKIIAEEHHSHKQERAENGTFTSDNPKKNLIRVTDDEQYFVDQWRKVEIGVKELLKALKPSDKKYCMFCSPAVELEEGSDGIFECPNCKHMFAVHNHQVMDI